MNRSGLIHIFSIIVYTLIMVGVGHQAMGQIETEKGLYVIVEVDDDDVDKLIYSGYIQEETDSEFLVIQTKSKTKIRIPFDRIISMETERSLARKDSEKHVPIQQYEQKDAEEIEEAEEYGFNETGFYFVIGPDLSISTRNFFDLYGGAEMVIGYKFNRLVALGAGFAYRDYTYDVWPSGVAQVFGEIRGFFLKNNTSPYYRLKVGYGNSWSGGVGNYEASTGGLYFSPSIGLRMIGGSMFKLNLETGLNHQRITYLDTDFGAIERKYTISRHYIGISLMY